MKQARTGLFTDEPFYDCQYDWAEDCFVQAGDKGIFFSNKKGNYRASFFEAFPRNPNTFIRSEGKSMEEAEKKAWEKYIRYIACVLDHHDSENFERRSYTNGVGFCKSCGMFKGECFEPSEKCHNCGKFTYYTSDRHNRFWCEDCKHLVAEEDLSEVQKILRRCEEAKDGIDEGKNADV